MVEQPVSLFMVEEPARGQTPMSSATEAEMPDDEEPRLWRGVYAPEFPQAVLFTKRIDIRPNQLDEWRPETVTDNRQVRPEDE
jgi:hypothetical protein